MNWYFFFLRMHSIYSINILGKLLFGRIVETELCTIDCVIQNSVTNAIIFEFFPSEIFQFSSNFFVESIFGCFNWDTWHKKDIIIFVYDSSDVFQQLSKRFSTKIQFSPSLTKKLYSVNYRNGLSILNNIEHVNICMNWGFSPMPSWITDNIS